LNCPFKKVCDGCGGVIHGSQINRNVSVRSFNSIFRR